MKLLSSLEPVDGYSIKVKLIFDQPHSNTFIIHKWVNTCDACLVTTTYVINENNVSSVHQYGCLLPTSVSGLAVTFSW